MAKRRDCITYLYRDTAGTVCATQRSWDKVYKSGYIWLGLFTERTDTWLPALRHRGLDAALAELLRATAEWR